MNDLMCIFMILSIMNVITQEYFEASYAWNDWNC